jgi:hypothetical protein
MSLRKELREIRRERHDLIQRNVLLRKEFKIQFDNVLMYVQVANQLISVVGRLVGGRRARHRHRHRR